mgnify:CR=1 FL=1|jgi:dTDP-4-dehydrorhamnose 3,5-epimerase
MIKDILLTDIPIIKTPGGDVLHGIKNSDFSYKGFGEAYFSKIKYKSIKAWKRHKKMTLNLIVPIGEIRFIMFDDRGKSSSEFQEVIISTSNYVRLTVPPMIWLGFEGISKGESVILNIADIEHDPMEVDKKNIEDIDFNWSN